MARNRIYDAEYMKKYRDRNKHTGKAYDAHAKWYAQNSNSDGALCAGTPWSEHEIKLMFEKDCDGKSLYTNMDLTKILRRTYAAIAQAKQKHKGNYANDHNQANRVSNGKRQAS